MASSTVKQCGVFSVVILIGLQPTFGQDNAAAERARLGDQRVQAELERRNRELASAAAAAPVLVEPATEEAPDSMDDPGGETAVAGPQEPAELGSGSRTVRSAITGTTNDFSPARRPEPVPRVAPNANIDDTLEQLKALGELRDAGYLDEAEFERIKRRIIEDNF